MIDLTTLEGQDTEEKVRALCYKARHLHDSIDGLPTWLQYVFILTLLKLQNKN